MNRFSTSVAAPRKNLTLRTKRSIANAIEQLEARRLFAVTFSNADLVDGWFIAAMGGGGPITYDGAGNITGGSFTDESGANPLSGTYALTPTGELTLTPTGSEAMLGALNATKDVAAVSNNGESSLVFATKRAASGFATEDLVGTWSILINGLEGSTGGGFNDNTGHGDITFTSDGNFTGTFTADESNTTSPVEGTFTIAADGTVLFAVTDGNSFTGVMNISKNVVAMNPVDFAAIVANNESRLVVLVKTGGTNSNAAVKGHWTMALDGGTGELDLDGLGHVTGTVNTESGAGVVTGTYNVTGAGVFTLNAHTVDGEGAHDDAYAGVVDSTHDLIAMGKPNSGLDGLNDLVILIGSGQPAEVATIAPTISALTASADTITRGGKLTLTAASPVDLDGKIKFVEFFVDSDDDGVLSDGDAKVGRDAGAAGGYIANVKTIKLPSGEVTFFAVATDNAGNQSEETSVVVTLENVAPTIKKLTLAPSKAIIGKPLNLIATGAKDIDGTIEQVDFFLDDNGNGVFDSGSDDPIDSDVDPAGGWKITIDTSDIDPGQYTIFAQAIDNDGDESAVSSATLNVARSGKDLAIDSATATPAALDHTTADQSLAISLVARNFGVASSGAFTEEFFLSTDSTLSDDDISLGTLNVGSIQGTKTRTDSKTFTFADPTTVPTAGTYFLIVKIDSLGKATESDETNNNFISESPAVTIT